MLKRSFILICYILLSAINNNVDFKIQTDTATRIGASKRTHSDRSSAPPRSRAVTISKVRPPTMQRDTLTRPDFLGVDWLDWSSVHQLHSLVCPFHQAASVEDVLRNVFGLYEQGWTGMLTSLLCSSEGMATSSFSEEERCMAVCIKNYREAYHGRSGLIYMG